MLPPEKIFYETLSPPFIHTTYRKMPLVPVSSNAKKRWRQLACVICIVGYSELSERWLPDHLKMQATLPNPLCLESAKLPCARARWPNATQLHSSCPGRPLSRVSSLVRLRQSLNVQPRQIPPGGFNVRNIPVFINSQETRQLDNGRASVV